MTEPTDADRQRARELIMSITSDSLERGMAAAMAKGINILAAAIAAARAEGFEAGLREPERRAREFLGDPAKGVSGHGK